MRRRALLTIAWLGATAGFGFVGCGKTASHSPNGSVAGASGEGGEGMPAGAGGGGAVGGSRGGRGGSTGLGGSDTGGGSSGGRAGASTGGASGARGGTGSATGGTGSATGGTSGAGGTDGPGGGGAGGGVPDPVICDRFGEIVASRLSDRVAFAFERAYYADCRLAWFSTLYLSVGERADYLRNLRLFTVDLWGCRDMAPTTFSLIHTPVPLSDAEAQALIEFYLNTNRIEAQLSPSEVAIVRRQLEELAAPLIDSNLADFSRSRCPGDGGGGQGGAGDAGGAAGLGGGG